ncbi:MAG: hypothetical protein ACRDX9_11690 [Acidimicrobiia bacterium]
MAARPDAIVEIPPPEARPGWDRRWVLAAALLAAAVTGVVFVTVTRPRVAPVEWARQAGPAGSANLGSLVATVDGFAMLSGMTVDGVRLWSSPDGISWDSSQLEAAPSQLAPVGDGLIAYGVRIGRIITGDSAGWVQSDREIAFPAEVRSRQGSGRPSVIGGEGGFVTMSLFGDVWWSVDGSDFDQVVAEPDWGPGQTVNVPFDSACRPPTTTSPDVPPVVATDAGFAAMISSNPAEPFGIWPVCEPEIWFSENGHTWTASEASLGDGAYVYTLGWREGRFTAVGGLGMGQPMVWTSVDGRDWEPIDSFSLSGIDLYTVAAGPAGWVILGRASQGADTVGWTSQDGLCWTSFPAQVDGAAAAITTESIVLVDRITYPETWVGTATGGRGSC